MSFTKNSELDCMNNISADDLIKAFDLNERLARTIKYIVRYSQHSRTSNGVYNLKRAIDELSTELKYSSIKQ